MAMEGQPPGWPEKSRSDTGPCVRHPTASWEGRLANAKCSCWAGTEGTLGKVSVDMALVGRDHA